MAGSDQLIIVAAGDGRQRSADNVHVESASSAQYKDRAVHEHVGAAGGAVQFEVAGAREELLRRINEVVARQEHFAAMDSKDLQ